MMTIKPLHQGGQFIMITTPNCHTKGTSGDQLGSWQLLSLLQYFNEI